MHPTLPILIALAAHASAHGQVVKPKVRQPGPATAAACGQKLVDFYSADGTSYPEAFMRTAGWDGPGYDAARCNMWLCKGYQLEESDGEEVAAYAPGASVDMEVYIRIPHRGYANLSVVDLVENRVIGEPLKVWGDGYADGAVFPDLPVDQTRFSVTVPDLGDKCVDVGACAIQWYWFGQGQTYENCIDFTQEVAAPVIKGRKAGAKRL